MSKYDKYLYEIIEMKNAGKTSTKIAKILNTKYAEIDVNASSIRSLVRRHKERQYEKKQTSIKETVSENQEKDSEKENSSEKTSEKQEAPQIQEIIATETLKSFLSKISKFDNNLSRLSINIVSLDSELRKARRTQKRGIIFYLMFIETVILAMALGMALGMIVGYYTGTMPFKFILII